MAVKPAELVFSREDLRQRVVTMRQVYDAHCSFPLLSLFSRRLVTPLYNGYFDMRNMVVRDLLHLTGDTHE